MGATDFNFGANVKKQDRREWWQDYKRKVYSRACELRDKIRDDLSRKCKKCGKTEEEVEAEEGNYFTFHHPRGRRWEPNKMNLLQRMRRYMADHKRGKLELWCNKCNSEDGSVNRKKYSAVKHR